MWIPKWLGESYAILYEEFRLETFKFNDVLKVLPINIEMAKAALSKLHKKSLLVIFEKRKPRLYRLIDPENFIALASGKVNKVVIPQEKYLKLIYDCCKALRKNIDLTSLAVYGSIARGTASNTSDIDLFIVSNSLKGTLGQRIDYLMYVVRKDVEDEIKFLQEKGIYTFLSFYPLREEEVEKLPLIMLDMVNDAKIVYDKNSFLEKQLLKLKLKLIEIGAKRIYIGKDKWYWDLYPNYKPLEVVPI